MVLKLTKKLPTKPAPVKVTSEPEEQQEESPFDTDGTAEEEAEAAAPAPAPAKKPVSPAGKKPAMSFIKRGADAKAGLAREEKKAELRKNQIQRYYLPTGAAGDITFLDGDVKDGILDIPFCHEHQLNMGGHWRNWFVCTQDEEPCPICEGGANSAYVGYLTVIDHSEYKDKNGVTHKDEIRLFAAKKDTIKLLQTYAVKRGGLRGCRFDVSRVGDKAPAVGSAFDFTMKLTEQQLVQKYKTKDKDKSKPIAYDDYLAAIYQPASELRKQGFGSMNAPIGSESAPEGKYEM